MKRTIVCFAITILYLTGSFTPSTSKRSSGINQLFASETALANKVVAPQQWERSYAISFRMRIRDKNDVLNRYAVQFRVVDMNTRKTYIANKQYPQDTSESTFIEATFPEDFGNVSLGSGIYTWSCLVNGKVILSQGSFQVQRVANTFTVNSTDPRWVPLTGQMRGIVWQMANNPIARIGLRDRYGSSSYYTANFSLRYPSGYVAQITRQSSGNNWIYVEDDVGAGIVWKCVVSGVEVAAGYWDVRHKGSGRGNQIKSQDVITFSN